MRQHLGIGRDVLLAVGVTALLLAMPATASGQPAETFLSNGDEISGWEWLRDPGGCAYGTWSFWGTPTVEALTITFGLLATDGVNGGPGVDAQAWVTVGGIESDAPGPAILGPTLLTFPNVSAPDDPVGYTTLGTATVQAADLSPTMQGIWVLVERRAPSGEVLPVDIAVDRDAVTVTGLAGMLSELSASPAPSASSVPSVPAT